MTALRGAQTRLPGDGAAVCLAVAAALGAWWSLPVPPTIGAVLVVAALLASRLWLLVPSVLVLATGLGHQAWQGIDDPPERSFDGEVLVTNDPRTVDGAVVVEVKAGSRRLEAWGRRDAAAGLRDRLAGEHVRVSGQLRPLVDKPWLTRRHLAGQLTVEAVHGHREGNPVARVANRFRRLLGRGAASMPVVPRSLFGGLVLGDVREQPVETADDFRRSGLTHLLAVSGQNVAFVLAATAPVLSRLGLRARWGATLGVLGFFALVTRFEPSVLRATAMAVLATSAAAVGRRPSSVRLLALAVAALLLIDPFLVGSVAFGLSVGASAGIVLLSEPLARRLPGPAVLTAPLAVTVAAQVGVTPVLVPIFGGLPVASIPANLLVGPFAGFVMTWGLTGGLVAGLVGGAVAELIHLPTRAALWWVATVARSAGDLPLGELDLALAALAAGAGTCATFARRRGRSGRALLAAIVTVAVLAVPSFRLASTRPDHEQLDGVGELWRTTERRTVLVLDDDVHHRRILDPVRGAGVRRIDLVVAPRGSSRTGLAMTRLRRRVAVAEVWAPPDHRVAFARTPHSGVYTFDDLVIEVRLDGERLDAAVRRQPGRQERAR